MFKSILPSKRLPSADFTMITNLTDLSSGKENLPNSEPGGTTARSNIHASIAGSKGPPPLDKKKRAETKQNAEAGVTGMEQAFDKLLDDLQIPSTLRPKLNGMDSSVKAAMLKSSQTMTVSAKTHVSPPATPRVQGLRRAHSIESLGSPHRTAVLNDYENLEPPNTSVFAQVSSHHSPYQNSPSQRKTSHGRGLSFDAPRLFSRSQIYLPDLTSAADFTNNTKEKIANVKISPSKFFSILSSTSSTQLDVEDLKKLRLLLRNESASWSQDFLKLGGYSALLTRLNEILEVEWREEQHDDQVLHELLKCLKALSTSSIGCFALRSSCPTPFVQLIALLYSDKKPGEVATRQLIVDLLLILFELFPPSSLPSIGASRPSSHVRSQLEAWQSKESVATSSLIVLPAPHKTFFSLVRALLLTPAPPPSESPAAPISPHAFIESLHRPRIYKTYLQELSELCRDYFWVFCHPNNTIWVLSETDETRVEKPRAPGGMTGGVEFEAMAYFTTHLRLINALSRCVADMMMPKEHDHSAYRFHMDLFLSGLERIILISRKASTAYYPTLHLELARYIDHAVNAGYELPYTVSRLIGIPPPALAKQSVASIPNPCSGRSTPARHAGLASPMKRTNTTQAPALPQTKRFDPIRFDEAN